MDGHQAGRDPDLLTERLKAPHGNQPVNCWRMTSGPTARPGCAFVLVAFAFFAATPWVISQERPFDTNACALSLHPEKYNEGLVSVDGLVTVGANEFMLHDASCGDQYGKIWLEFGGDVGSPATGVTPHQAAGKPRTFEGLELPITKDRDFDAMQKLLQSVQKSEAPKMLRATLIGKYFAGRPTKLGSGETIHGGYGHMGCCSLFVIEEVVKVSAELEEIVDFSPLPATPPKALPKGCIVTETSVPPREDEDQLELKSLEAEFQYLHNPKKVAARAIAVQQDIDAEDIEKHLRTESSSLALVSYAWETSDGLTSYSIVVNKPYWLLPTAQTGDAVIWVPKKIIRTECRKPEVKPNIPIKH